jgi:hypothetical protein
LLLKKDVSPLDFGTKNSQRNNSTEVTIDTRISMKNQLVLFELQRDEFWPNGILADKPPERDANVRNITQVLCKAKLLGIVSGN